MKNSISNSYNKKEYPYFVAALSKDTENVESSSSGGIFYELSRYVIGQKGVVYGAVQVGLTEVEHRRAECLEQTKQFRRSKYLRSQLKECYALAKNDLEQGKIVLFSGVGCQIAGLYKFLGKTYEKLITCEVVCHGAPLTEALEKYIKEKENKKEDKATWINFRDKSKGWKDNCIAEYYASGQCDITLSSEHPVHSLYLQGIDMESNCSSCQYAKLPRIADITLADFWQYKGNIKHNNRGMSLLAVNTILGEQVLKRIETEIYCEPTTKEFSLSSCRHMAQTPSGHKSHKAFRKLIKTEGFHAAYDLCNQFGEIVVAEDLCAIKDLSEKQVFKIFQDDTQEIIYSLDMENRVVGIVTYGFFITHYANRESWVNEKFNSVRMSDDLALKIAEIFNGNEKINRVPIFDDDGHLLYEVRRNLGGNGKEDTRKVLMPFAKLAHSQNKCFFVKRPDLLEDISVYKDTEVKRIKDGISFPVMHESWKKYKEDFIDVFGNDVTEEYIDGLCKIPQIMMREERYQHLDGSSQYVNVINGCRITVGQPFDYDYTIHIYGRCGVFGYAVEDKDTLPSALQGLLNKLDRKVRIVNHGLWGADDTNILHNMSCDIDDGIVEEQDIIIVYMAYLPWMEELKRLSVLVYDSTQPFHDFLKGEATFFDRPGHMTAAGYLFIAQFIYEKLEENKCLNTGHIHERSRVIKLNQKMSNEIGTYLSEIKRLLPMTKLSHEKVGAIVVNCNPFTKGHRFLIEEAIKKVDALIIFVLEENRSYFSFEDRYEMVKMGTADLENVYVIPSGKFIISAITFPEYFLKEQYTDLKINAAGDVKIFGKDIAPSFNIITRFVGTEPTDKVTNQYNEELKKVLPGYGIELCEITRLKTGDRYVTATEVRKNIDSGNYGSLYDLLPETTINYLVNMGKMKG